MSRLTQPSDERPSSAPPSSATPRAVALAAAYADAVAASSHPGEALPTTLLRALGVGTYETMADSAGLALFAEALSTLHVLHVCRETGGMGDSDVNRWDDAFAAVRLRLEGAFALVHVELCAAREGAAGGDDDAETAAHDDEPATLGDDAINYARSCLTEAGTNLESLIGCAVAAAAEGGDDVQRITTLAGNLTTNVRGALLSLGGELAEGAPS